MKTRTPFDLLLDQLSDLYSVESQLLDSFPDLLEKVSDSRLKGVIASHLQETLTHAETVARILASQGMKPGRDKCKAMEGLVKGGHSHINAVDEPSTRDLMIIAHCLRIEHYEMGGYSISKRLAESLALTEVAAQLGEILEEERKAKNQLIALEPPLFAIASSQTTDSINT